MNKPELHTVDKNSVDTQTQLGTRLHTITETMRNPEFAPEQLPALWEQITEPNGTPLTHLRDDRWRGEIEAMFQRCDTYPQHTKLSGILYGMPDGAWHRTAKISDQARELLLQATPEQLVQALNQERRHTNGSSRMIDNQIMSWAKLEQLTGSVIEQLKWDHGMAAKAGTPDVTRALPDRWEHVVEHIQQTMLNGDNNAWGVFLGIIDQDTTIGSAAEIAVAIEQPNRPNRQKPQPHNNNPRP